jgi:hypothetical protein
MKRPRSQKQLHPLRGQSPLARFLAYIEITPSCWLWTASLDKDGYGTMQANHKKIHVHRFSYEHFVGPIPEGLTVDHVCHNANPDCRGGRDCQHRRCIRPDHLEPVPDRINLIRGNSPFVLNSRKTHCKHGHEYSEVNTYVARRGTRHCRTCRQRWTNENRARKRQLI